MDEWAKVVVWGSEQQLGKADDALEAAGGYAKGFVYADEGGDGWAMYFVARPFLGRFSQIVSECGCSVGRGRQQTFDAKNNGDPLLFRGLGESAKEAMAKGSKGAEVKRLRAKIRKLVTMGEDLSWGKVIDMIARDNYLASRVTTKTVRQVLQEFFGGEGPWDS